MTRSLNSHPDIACFGEMLKPDPPLEDLKRLGFEDGELQQLRTLHDRDTAGFLDTILERAARKGFAASGLKLFYYHAREKGRDHSIWESIAHREDLRIIHLHREDVFATYLSRQLAATTDQWHHAVSRGGNPDYDTRVDVDIDDFCAFRNWLIDYVQKTRSDLPANRTYELTYEKFTSNFEESIADIFRFLAVSPRSTNPPLVKQARRPWQEYVTNADEVAELLAKLNEMDETPRQD